MTKRGRGSPKRKKHPSSPLPISTSFYVTQHLTLTSHTDLTIHQHMRKTATTILLLSSAVSSSLIELHDPQHRVLQPSDFEPQVYFASSTSFLEQKSEPNPQLEAPARLECECDFVKSNPLGRPDSEYHEGRLLPPNQPSELKSNHFTSPRNPNSKVEDSVDNYLSAATTRTKD